jgi:hypothetical protein
MGFETKAQMAATVIASAEKQSMALKAERWIASLRPQQRK